MSNSLAKVHPELVSEWAERNFPLTPDDITYGSNKRVWWKGSCGHEWQASVKARSKGEGCPICSGARVVAGINDFATINPRLVSEWSEKNTIKPTEVTVGSHKKVIWKCEHGHEWTATVKCLMSSPANSLSAMLRLSPKHSKAFRKIWLRNTRECSNILRLLCVPKTELRLCLLSQSQRKWSDERQNLGQPDRSAYS